MAADMDLAQLRGKIWIADFIYTTCTDTCPLQTAAMAELQEEFAASTEVQLVSVSVDPERDTPQVLSAYAEKHAADRRALVFSHRPAGSGLLIRPRRFSSERRGVSRKRRAKRHDSA